MFRFFIVILGLMLFALPAVSSSNPLGQSQYGLCKRCHGIQGQGIANLKAPAIAGLPAWYIQNQLKSFSNGGRGKHADDIPGMRMRSMARTLKKPERVKAVSEYIASLTPVQPKPTLKMGDPLKGKAKFATCIACHGADGKGLKALNAPPLIYTNDWYTHEQLKNFQNKVRGARPDLDPIGATMAPMAMTLTGPTDLIDIIAYIHTLRTEQP